jgi:hypothetical protein
LLFVQLKVQEILSSLIFNVSLQHESCNMARPLALQLQIPRAARDDKQMWVCGSRSDWDAPRRGWHAKPGAQLFI